MKGTWRQDQGIETLHKYYSSCDWLDDNDIDELLPEDDIPEQLNFKDLGEAEDDTTVSRAIFRDWLTEGKLNCDVAQVLLNFWLDDRAQNKQCETVDDFFFSLLQQKCEDETLDNALHTDDNLSLQWIANFIVSHCALPYTVPDTDHEIVIRDLSERIKEEILGVQAYVNVWRGSTTVQKKRR